MSKKAEHHNARRREQVENKQQKRRKRAPDKDRRKMANRFAYAVWSEVHKYQHHPEGAALTSVYAQIQALWPALGTNVRAPALHATRMPISGRDSEPPAVVVARQMYALLDKHMRRGKLPRFVRTRMYTAIRGILGAIVASDDIHTEMSQRLLLKREAAQPTKSAGIKGRTASQIVWDEINSIMLGEVDDT
jgi:hypothetical protein